MVAIAKDVDRARLTKLKQEAVRLMRLRILQYDQERARRAGPRIVGLMRDRRPCPCGDCQGRLIMRFALRLGRTTWPRFAGVGIVYPMPHAPWWRWDRWLWAGRAKSPIVDQYQVRLLWFAASLVWWRRLDG